MAVERSFLNSRTFSHNASSANVSTAARVRGTLALGYLGVYGAEAVLAEYLLERRHDQPERHAAAFALGSLPDDHPSPAIGDYLDQATGGSYKRHRDTLAARELAKSR